MRILPAIYASTIKPSFIVVMLTVVSMLLPTVKADIGDGKVALIAAKGSGIVEMHIREVRRIYLGLKSVESAAVKRPVLNIESRLLYDEFLKNTMHLTEGSYKRKLVKRMFRNGGEKIEEMVSLKALNEHLLDHVGDISFVEVSSVDRMKNIEVIQILW
ncbi:MAG: hypothetical protein KAT12_03305 [Gammaproteobacteria bacterium]|nr:hypothetical protein [Gammaproteobacteria bacterium]